MVQVPVEAPELGSVAVQELLDCAVVVDKLYRLD
jgi:hypothetical protein